MLFSQKLTVFLALGALIILICTPIGLYNVSRGGTNGIVGVYMLIGVGLALLLIGLDRLSLRFVDARVLSLVELALLLVAYFGYAYSARITTLDLSGNASPYFAVVWTNQADRAEKRQYQFPFDHVIRVSDRAFVCLDQGEFDRLTLTLPAGWHDGSRTKGFTLNHPHYPSIYIHQPEDRQLSDAELDQVKQRVLDQLARRQ